jgi:hypothetical protein
MADDETPAAAVSYATSDTPVALPELALLGVKLIGLYTIVRGVFHIFNLSWILLNPDARQTIYLVEHLQLATNLVTGVLLIWRADWVVTRIIRVPRGEAPPVQASEHFQAIGFSLVGVLLMAWGLSELAYVFGRYVLSQWLFKQGAVDEALPLERFINPFVEFGCGLVLFLRGHGLAALWHRMRYGGVRVRPTDPHDPSL